MAFHGVKGLDAVAGEFGLPATQFLDDGAGQVAVHDGVIDNEQPIRFLFSRAGRPGRFLGGAG
jgi:hypothetical protein